MNDQYKKLLFFALISIIVFVLIVAFFIVSNLGRQTTQPSGAIPSGQGANPGVIDKQSAADEEQNRRSYAVTQLIDKLPYSGKDFSISYTYSSATFILYINPNKTSEGNAEFDAFLKKNGVGDRSWINNLFISYISPTPTR